MRPGRRPCARAERAEAPGPPREAGGSEPGGNRVIGDPRDLGPVDGGVRKVDGDLRKRVTIHRDEHPDESDPYRAIPTPPGLAAGVRRHAGEWGAMSPARAVGMAGPQA